MGAHGAVLVALKDSALTAGLPKAGEARLLAIVDSSGRVSLLEVLEYGSSHRKPITPYKAKALHFTTRGGDEVFTMRVDHPGTKAYGMVRKTRAALARWQKKFVRKWQKRIERDW